MPTRYDKEFKQNIINLYKQGESAAQLAREYGIGYVLSKAYWGQGLMTEAVKEVIRFCKDECSLDALTIGHFVENERSRRVIEKCGFKFVKTSECESKQLQKTFTTREYILPISSL